MALLTKFLGKNHSFHRITSPTHILGTPSLLLRQNQPNPVCSTTGHTPYMDGQDSTSLWFINKISREKPLFSPHHLPHTHSWDSFPFTEAQLTQPSLFDHRTHTLYGRTGLYVSMALLKKFLGKNHSFHRITAPTHILGTPPLSLRHNKLNPVRSTTGHTPNKDGQDSTSLWLYLQNF